MEILKNQNPGSLKRVPKIFIFSIVLGAEYSSHVKSIETHARVFLTLNILYIGTVKNTIKINQDF